MINYRYMYLQAMTNCPVHSSCTEDSSQQHNSFDEGTSSGGVKRRKTPQSEFTALFPHRLLPGERSSLLPVKPEQKVHPRNRPETTRHCQGQIEAISRICDLDISCHISILHLNIITSAFERCYDISFWPALGHRVLSLFVLLFYPWVFKDRKVVYGL